METGNEVQIDPYNAGYDQSEQHPGATEPTDQSIVVHERFPYSHEQHPTGYVYPMNNAVIVTNAHPANPGLGVQRGFDWLIPAILSTLFCCLPLGICAIIMATQATKKFAVGDVIGGHKSSRSAKILVITSIIIGIVIWIITGIRIYNMITTMESEKNHNNGYHYGI
uniref:Uncharacterized protein LOC111138492 isoform X2 n=1 Tax=Crassostrea virginica TaxID=6565 RepID=A0A8B8F1K1_CRAVI|nr:uncharacterized protein LOC111138492 isoform X2 [Crassostrea virginica]